LHPGQIYPSEPACRRVVDNIAAYKQAMRIML
jgi:hypothetical protein